jgi:quercetin dioxygenase-like cupin family protein/alkylhydroperoxidase/carboxymuconolactone decarboxylase family protein YurZ
MASIKILLLSAVFISCLTEDLNGQQSMNTDRYLDKKQQSIVAISAFTANGDMTHLQKALNDGLDAGLTVNEIKEVLVQLYAYAGFPRSLNALNNLISVLKGRTDRGINDPLGKEPSPLPIDKSKLQFGTEMQTKLVGQPVKGEVFEFAPAIDQFLKEHLFGNIFGRDNLDWKTRELATISTLAAIGGVENQLRSHFGVGMYNGITQLQLHHLVSLIHSNVGAKEGDAAREVLQNVLGNTEKGPQTIITHGQQKADIIFPTGQKITNDNFTGTAWLQQLIVNDSINSIQVGNVTFEPGARTKWHYHPAGQILLVTNGIGRYQEKGKPVRELRKGDVIKCEPNIIHWHGAAPDNELSHIAIGTNSGKGTVGWLQPVSDEEYNGSD